LARRRNSTREAVSKGIESHRAIVNDTEGSEHRSTQMNESSPRNRDRLLVLHEILFPTNIACALVYASLVYISKNQASVTPANDSTYYFVRSAYRIDDLLRLSSINSVSTSAGAREFPSRWSQVGDELLILITVLSVAALFLLLLRLIARTSAYHTILDCLAGVTTLFALPVCYLCVSELTWKWVPGPLPGPSYSFWRSAPLAIFTAEILCLGILFAIYRKRPIPAWTLRVLLFLHYPFWILVLWSEVRINLYVLYTPRLLLLLFPLSGIVWLLCLRQRQLQAAEIGAHARAGKVTFATAVVALAVLLLVWLPSKWRSLARTRNMESLVVQLSRGPCFGSCPSYSITIHGNGSVEYAGGRHVRVPGTKTAAISREQVIEVLRSLDRIYFSNLEDRAFSWCFDTSSVSVSVSVDGKTKRVVSDSWCTGAKSGLQAQFVKSATEIDEIVGSERWVRCDGPCGK
jgi:hypothetical protein